MEKRSVRIAVLAATGLVLAGCGRERAPAQTSAPEAPYAGPSSGVVSEGPVAAETEALPGDNAARAPGPQPTVELE